MCLRISICGSSSPLMSNSIIVAAMTSPNLQESRPDAVGAAMEIEVNDVIPLAHAYTAFRVGVPIGRTNRKKRDRFFYPDWYLAQAGFITVKGNFTPAMLWCLLRNDPNVYDICLHEKGSKAVQGNFGYHTQEHNFQVKLYDAAESIEVEVTRHGHVRNERFMATTTIVFKSQPRNQIVPAWDMLRTAALQHAVQPAAVDAWYNAVVTWHRCNIATPRPTQEMQNSWDAVDAFQ